MRKMTISQQGIDLIKEYEGLRLEAYKCPAGVWTIGYGSTKGVKEGMKITQLKAEKLLMEDIKPIELFINKVRVNFVQEEFDSLCSFIYNLGTGNFNSSTMRQYIIGDREDEEITDQMVKWILAGGKPLTGLKRRRIAEANMFLGKERYYLDEENNIKKK
jgi:lysozyme